MGRQHSKASHSSVFGDRTNFSQCYSVFLASYLSGTELQGASSFNFALLGGMLWGVPFLVCPIAVRIEEKLGNRVCLLLGVVFECGSLIAASFATHVWHLFLAQGIGFAAGIGFFQIATQNILMQWFTRRRSLAAGLAATGTGVGGLTYALVAGRLISETSTAMALRIIAIIAGCVTFGASMVIRGRKQDLGGQKYAFFDLALFTRPRFLLLVTYACFNMLGEIIILEQLVSFAYSNVGVNHTQGSVVGAMICLGQILGRTSIGYLSDRLGRLNMATVAAFGAGLVTLVIWPFAKSYGVLIVYCIFVGAFA